MENLYEDKYKSSDLNDEELRKVHNETRELMARMPIGTLLPSVLTPQKVSEITGGSWVLADGRIAPPEFLAYTGLQLILDLRGVFIRGLNAGKKLSDIVNGRGGYDYGGEREPGDYQRDSTKLPNSPYQGKRMANGDL